MRATGVMAALAIAAAALPATAQEPVAEGDRQAQTYLAEFAQCVVGERSYRRKVDGFLRTVPDSDGFAAAALRAADLHCLDAAARRTRSTITMHMQPAAFRMALYPALYRRDFGRIGPVEGIAAAPAADLSQEFESAAAALPADYRANRALGDCVARAAPAPAHALLIVGPFDPAEETALEQLRPAIASCVSEGQTIAMDRTVLRAAIGEAMYKASQALSAPAAARG